MTTGFQTFSRHVGARLAGSSVDQSPPATPGSVATVIGFFFFFTFSSTRLLFQNANVLQFYNATIIITTLPMYRAPYTPHNSAYDIIVLRVDFFEEGVPNGVVGGYATLEPPSKLGLITIKADIWKGNP